MKKKRFKKEEEGKEKEDEIKDIEVILRSLQNLELPPHITL